MRIELGIGAGKQAVSIPDENVLGVLTPNDVTYDLTQEAEVRRALENPIGSKRLCELVRPGEKIVIITSDITRPLPSYILLPPLLEELEKGGIGEEDITLVFALGSHRKHTEEEMIKLVGESVYRRIRCVDADTTDCVHLGVTKRGTPVDIDRVVAQADKRICLGNIEYHYFAGYSGGAKAIMPGVSTRAAIQANHSKMTDERAFASNLEDNPVRQDLEEGAAMCGMDFILNVVLDEHKKIIHAVAGDGVKAHRSGCAFLDTLYLKTIDEKADIVIVSQGGAPKDLNLYQTQKALDNAKHAVKEGGIIILVGSCKEGLGEHVFEEWIQEAKAPRDLIERVEKDFKLGGHKAAAIAMVLEMAEIYLVSEMEPEFVKTIFMDPYDTVQSALDAAMKKKGDKATVIVMPYGGSTLPKLKQK